MILITRLSLLQPPLNLSYPDMQLQKKIRYLFKPKAIALMYHRITELKSDPWQLAVSPNNFEQHLQVLQKKGKLIKVKEMVSSLKNNAVANNSICLTFDDGYTDNYLKAKPLLEKYKCPATFFIPTYYTGQEQGFWWDELESILLCYPDLPAKFSMPINGKLLKYDLENDSTLTNAQLSKHRLWAWPASPPTRRCELYLEIWQCIRPLPYTELQAVVNEIKCWASFSCSPGTGSLPMTHSQLCGLVTHPLIDLGLHTVTHPALSYHTIEVQRLEIAGNKKKLEKIVGKPVETIAYPYGDYNDITLSVVKELNLNAAFTTAEKVISNLTDPYRIGRFQVKNWNGNEFEKWLVKWQTSAQFL